MKHSLRSAFALLLAVAACGPDAPPPPAVGAAAPETARFVLAADPGEAFAVTAAKAKGPAPTAVVQGRIAAIVKGFAVFTLMDKVLPYCGETDAEDDCKTPWDYCCEPVKTRTEHAMVVELRGADGKPIATPSLPDLRLLDDVKVQGELTKDADGNFVFVARGVFRVNRPTLPEGLKWPQ